MPEQSIREKRKDRRFNVLIKAEIDRGETERTALVCNVSRKGLYAIMDQPFCPATKCHMTFTKLCLEVHGEVVRVDENGMAIEFAEMLEEKTLDLLTTASSHS